MKTSFIFVTFEREGTHCYPDAATNPKLATGRWDDVSFLANKHRHIFKFTIAVEVFHSNRDLEFIQEKRFIQNLYNDKILDLDYKSCEMMSDDLYNQLSFRYFPDGVVNRDIRIEISEDGENGSIIYYNK